MRLPNDGSYKYIELVHGFCDVIKQQLDCPKDFHCGHICPHYDVDIMTKGELLKQISDIKKMIEKLMNRLEEKDEEI